MNPKATLNYRQRLKSRGLIEAVFKKGTAFNVFPFRVVVLFTALDMEASNAPFLQAGFSVSAKKFKKAVDRNRIKRLTKEAYRIQKHLLEQQLQQQKKYAAVFFIYTGKEKPGQALVKEKMGLILNKLIQLCSEKAATNT